MTEQKTPAGLEPAGRALWVEMTAGVAFRPDELAVLTQACRMADTVAALEDALEGKPLVVAGSQRQDRIHPAVQELRLSRRTLAALLGSLDVPEAGGKESPSSRGRKAARARWSNRTGGSVVDGPS